MAVFTTSCASFADQPERSSLLNELIAKGVRITPQRRVVIDIIQAAEHHLDAAALLDLAKKRCPDLDRATVYRTIQLLKKHHLVAELDLMHLQGDKHFYDVNPSRDRIHLACLHCGRIEEFSNPLFETLKLEISKQTGFEVRVTRLEVGGRCQSCLYQS